MCDYYGDGKMHPSHQGASCLQQVDQKFNALAYVIFERWLNEITKLTTLLGKAFLWYWLDKVAKKKKGVPIPDDDNLAHLIAAIGGGIEAPIQFILQVGISW